MNSNDSDLLENINKTAFDIFWKFLEEKSEELEEEDRKNQILIFTYSLLIIISLIGNILVCKVIFEKRSSLSTTNAMIANLAISDILMTVINIPFNIVRFVLANWPFGEALCVIVPFIQSVSVHCSSITMMFIAIERYKSLLHNSHLNCNCFDKCFPFSGILSLIWVLSAIFSIPHGIYNRVEPMHVWTDIIRCRVIYPEPKDSYNQRFTVISLLTQYLVPIIMTFVCYVRISVFLWRREIIGNPTEGHRISIIRRKKRRIKMLMMVGIVFAICWLPLNVYLLITAFKPNFLGGNLFFVCHWFAMSSVCYNPFIYCWLNENFRRRFKILFTCCMITRRQINPNPDNNSLDNNIERNRINQTNDLSNEMTLQVNISVDIEPNNRETSV